MENVSIPVMSEMFVPSALVESEAMEFIPVSIEMEFEVEDWASIAAAAVGREPLYVGGMKDSDLRVHANTFSLNGISFTTWVYPNCIPTGVDLYTNWYDSLTNSFTGFTDPSSIPDDAELKINYTLSILNPTTGQWMSPPPVTNWLLTRSRTDVGYPFLDCTVNFGTPLVKFETLRMKVNWTIVESNFDFND